MKAKAVCVMRTDLHNSDGVKVPKGKLIAQGGHAFVGLITKLMKCDNYEGFRYLRVYQGDDTPLQAWLNGAFTKIVLACNSEEELMELYEKAKEAKLNVVLITDSGNTEFSVPTRTCIGIGPAWEEEIDEITGHLKGFS